MNPLLRQAFLLFFLIQASCVTAKNGTYRRVRSIKGESRMNPGEGIKTANQNEIGWDRSTMGKLRFLGEKDDEKGKKGKKGEKESSESTDIVVGKKKVMKGEGKSSGKGMVHGMEQHSTSEKQLMTKKPKTGKEKGKGKESFVVIKEKKEKIGKQTDGIMKGEVEVSPTEAPTKYSDPTQVKVVKKEKKEMLDKETDDMLWKEVSPTLSPQMPVSVPPRPSPPPPVTSEPLITESPVVVSEPSATPPPPPPPTDFPTTVNVAETEQPSIHPDMTLEPVSPVESPSVSPDETDVPTCLECDDPNVN